MCYYSIKLTAAAIAVWLVYSIFVFFVYRRVIEFNRKLIACGNKTAGTVQQIFAGLAKFRVQGAEEQAYQLWARDYGEQWNWGLKLRWQNNYTSIISSIQPQLENLRPILKEVPENITDKADASVLTGVMEVSHLTFAYEGSEHDVLKDVSFKIAAGENVAIVGKSGCGKSTLVRLLLGFEQPKSGAIYYDGQDLAELSLQSLASYCYRKYRPIECHAHCYRAPVIND